MTQLGLPAGIRACLFDLDGVLTDTAAVHERAWKEMFDSYLKEQRHEDGGPFTAQDYLEYVDGKPRADGVRDFLASRGISLPEGDEHDAPGAITVQSLGDRKNAVVQQRIKQDGVRVYPGSLRYLHAAADAGLRRAVVSSSANTAQVLAVTGLEALVELRIDGVVAHERGLPGKPAPDTFVAAADGLGVAAGEAVVYEDATSGVAAGRAGGFGFVVGVDRSDPPSGRHADDLRRHGADVVVRDLADLLPGRPA